MFNIDELNQYNVLHCSVFCVYKNRLMYIVQEIKPGLWRTLKMLFCTFITDYMKKEKLCKSCITTCDSYL